jgi:large subunit ribosomal protein LP0
MPSEEKLAKKQKYFDKLIDLCINTPAALIISVDNVASKQMQDIRMELRGKAIVLMGKNTMIRKALTIGHEQHPDAGLETLKENMKGNVGFIFNTNSSLDEIRQIVGKHKKSSGAKSGQLSNVDLALPSGPTGMDPSQTSFFQALNIGTKIVKGQIELVSEFKILHAGEKVSPSAAVLLTKLGIKPFEYMMTVKSVFQDGGVFDAAVLDIKEHVLIQKFVGGIANMAAFSRELGIPTEAGLPHAMGNAFRNVASLVAEADFTFKEVEKVKEFLADPEAFAASNPVASGPAQSSSGDAAPKAAAAAAAVVEEEEEEDMDFDLFG